MSGEQKCQWPFHSLRECSDEGTEQIIVRGGGHLGWLCFEHAVYMEQRMERLEQERTARAALQSIKEQGA